jgi:SAM-dependent methyltransferase
MTPKLKDWVAYYDSPHSIYVNALHRDVHYATIADEIARYVPSPSAAVLDYGCGEALHADRIAAAAGRLTLVDAAPSVRARLVERFGNDLKITVVSAERAAAMPERSFDLVVLHSVSQYLSGEEFDRIAALFRRLLKPDGLFLLGDVVPHEVPAVSDAWALLRFAYANGFLLAALAGLVRTFFSDYWRLRSEFGLTRYSEAEMTARLARLGFTVTRAPRNIGHIGSRMTFLARPAAGSTQSQGFTDA